MSDIYCYTACNDYSSWLCRGKGRVKPVRFMTSLSVSLFCGISWNVVRNNLHVMQDVFVAHLTAQSRLWIIHKTRQIWGIWKLRPAYSPETPNLGQNRWFFVPCDLEIWWMTLENNRVSPLCCFKLCATFHSHRWIQTGVTVQKRPIWVKIDDF